MPETSATGQRTVPARARGITAATEDTPTISSEAGMAESDGLPGGVHEGGHRENGAARAE